MKKILIITITVLIFYYLISGVAAKNEALTAEGGSAEVANTSLSGGLDPCTLNDVECNENAYTLNADVTAYSEIDSCHYENCIMANGVRAYVGAVACPRNIKLGTKVEIDGIMYECADRTAKFVDGRFDIFFGYGQESYDRAIQFGKKKSEIIIYE